MSARQMSVCYHPTTVLFIDDNRKFLSMIRSHLDADKFSPRIFDNPYDALDFLSKDYKPDFFINRCLYRPEDDHADHRIIDVNIPTIHHEIYNPERFDQIAVVVVDYAMPGMNGGELCRRLKHCHLKIILLTAEADETKAVELFNEGLIQRFLRKNAEDFEQKLNETICSLQQLHFQELSEVVINGLTKHPDREASCLDDIIFIKFFDKLIRDFNISEYYLLDQSGSFLFIDPYGCPFWLLVKSDGDMDATEFEVNIEEIEIPKHILKGIRERTMMRHCFTDDGYPEVSEDWPNYMYPASLIEGRGQYYYSYVKKPYVPHGIDTDKIATFYSYLEGLKMKYVVKSDLLSQS